MAQWMLMMKPKGELADKLPNKHVEEDEEDFTSDNPSDELEARRRRRRMRYLLENAKAEITGSTPSSRLEMDDQLYQLKKKVTQLNNRLDEAEDNSYGNFALAKDGAVVGDELFKKLPHICKKAMKILKDPPKTWEQYVKNDDAMSIYKMETKELKKAMEEGKGDVDKEVMHVLAALLYRILTEEE